jgi:DNA excision repair protein ERCC-3
VRVDRVEVLESGSDGRFGGLCPDGYVYNLGVERDHTYLVDGRVVHNCLPAESFWRVVMACGAYFRIGLSATPFARGDRRSPMAVGALGHQIFEMKPQELQDAGVLSVPKIRFVPVVQESHLASAEPTMQGIKGELINGSTARNQALVKICQRAEKPCLLFVEQLRHGRELRHRLEKAGINCDFVFGADDTGRREAVVQRLVRGEIDVLVTSAIFQEGIDIPSLRSVVVGCGGKSTIATLQRIGRGMRVTPGKSTFEVWDVLDQGQKWLEKHAKARLRAYEREGYAVETIGGLP